ncbi:MULTISPECIES: hypothetical protein [Shouchella]|uniref:Uncharacterized protein n=1 Tax=Shouchella clausii TaxID=79880 RepID=A0A268S741_SHOCL|nr:MULTISPECIES: hypothetical protein [Shouchella]PAD43514.1 hypothetical protein CHH54_06630 [Bacillus sp. 7520-S]SPU19061.1 Uncharacterised protein [Niallia circulans]MBU8595482.1 hypothetical protein [Shouchella clausii]MCY1103529.1 hypothetical protein [Shouchella clausii]MEB5480233.1 hypothetical protein [Shouchella clausii]
MSTLSRVETARTDKQKKRVQRMERTKAGVLSSVAIGMAGCSQSSAMASADLPAIGTGVEQVAIAAQGNFLEAPAIRQSPIAYKMLLASLVEKRTSNTGTFLYTLKDGDIETNVYGFKTTSDPTYEESLETYNETGSSESTSEHNNEHNKLDKAEPAQKQTHSKETTTLVGEDDSSSRGTETTNDTLNDDSLNKLEGLAANNEAEKDGGSVAETESTSQDETGERENESSDLDQQESPVNQEIIQWNNHGQVVDINGNRFAIETEYGPKWFVLSEGLETSFESVRTGMVLSIYFTEQNGENEVSTFFITYTPDEGERAQFVDATFLGYTGENKQSILVYIPHQEVIYDLSKQLQKRDLDKEFEHGAAITIGTVMHDDGSVTIESIETTL